MHRNLGSKNMYKLFLGIVKYIPITLFIVKVVSTILNIFGVTCIPLTLFGGTSILFILVLYFIANIFRYCYLYKMPLYYITGLDLFIIFGKSFVEAIDMYRIIFITSGIFMIAYIIYAYLTRNKPKVDPIKNFCERYCNCC